MMMVSEKQPAATIVAGNPVEADAALLEKDRKVEQIRDILFGGLSREYDRRFQEFGDRLNQEIIRIDHELERGLAAMDGRMETLSERLLSQLRHKSNTHAMAMDDLDARLGQAMRTQRSELSAAIDLMEQDFAKVDARGREAVAGMHTEIAAGLQALREALASEREHINSKMSREDLADMMSMLSMHLRGALDLPDVD